MAVAGPFGKPAAAGPGMFSNSTRPAILGVIFERYDAPQRHPLGETQRSARFQPVSVPSPVSFVKPSGAEIDEKSRFSESSRISALA